jgi:hypothetical protein
MSDLSEAFSPISEYFNKKEEKVVSSNKTVENFSNLQNVNLNAIQTISEYAQKLASGGNITHDGNLTIAGNANVRNSSKQWDSGGYNLQNGTSGKIQWAMGLRKDLPDNTNTLGFHTYDKDGKYEAMPMEITKTGVNINGRMNVNGGVIQKGGDSITNTGDLGLYSRVNGNWMRYVTKNAPHMFFVDDKNGGAGENSEAVFSINPNKTINVNGNGFHLITMNVGDNVRQKIVNNAGQSYNAANWVCIIAGYNLDWHNQNPGRIEMFAFVENNEWHLRSEVEFAGDSAGVRILCIPIGYFSRIDSTGFIYW